MSILSRYFALFFLRLGLIRLFLASTCGNRQPSYVALAGGHRESESGMARSQTTSQTEETLDPSAALSGATSSDRPLAIYSIGRQLLEQRDPGEVIRTIHQALIDHLRPDHSCVLSVSRAGELKPLASHSLDLTGPESEWQLSHTACGKARETGLAVLMADQIDDLAIRDADSVDILKIRSIICVPLAQNPVKGLIYLTIAADRGCSIEKTSSSSRHSRYTRAP